MTLRVVSRINQTNVERIYECNGLIYEHRYHDLANQRPAVSACHLTYAGNIRDFLFLLSRLHPVHLGRDSGCYYVCTVVCICY